MTFEGQKTRDSTPTHSEHYPLTEIPLLPHSNS
jgi:hypothetical protein